MNSINMHRQLSFNDKLFSTPCAWNVCFVWTASIWMVGLCSIQNDFLHNVQRTDGTAFRFTWTFKCAVKSSFWANDLSHTEQVKGFSLLCTASPCFVRSFFLANDLSHKVQEKPFSLLWTMWVWLVRSPLNVNDFSHNVHEKGFNLWWTAFMCLERLLLFEKDLMHNVQVTFLGFITIGYNTHWLPWVPVISPGFCYYRVTTWKASGDSPLYFYGSHCLLNCTYGKWCGADSQTVLISNKVYIAHRYVHPLLYCTDGQMAHIIYYYQISGNRPYKYIKFMNRYISHHVIQSPTSATWAL